MDFAFDLAMQFAEALKQILLQPFYYLGVLFVILQSRRQILMERRLFNTRLHSLVKETARTLLGGLLAGLCVSAVMLLFGAALTPTSLLLVWAVSFVLVLFRIRYLCLAYATGVLGVLHVIVTLIPGLSESESLKGVVAPIAELDMPSLLALVGVLHLAEALLMRWQGAGSATPMFYEGKRGKIVGGYHLQGFWPMPLFLVVPLGQTGGSAGAGLPWAPLLGGDSWSFGWEMIAFPVVIGFMESTISQLPRAKVRRSSALLLLYSAVIIGLAVLADFWPVFTMGASLLCLLLHEVLIWYSGWSELQRSPQFVHSGKGLTVLDVLPKSAAAEMGIKPGEILQKVNGMTVLSKEDLHRAMQLQSAFCKLDVVNAEGHVRFVQRPMFAGEHHQLGIILAPDQNAMYYAGTSSVNLFSYVRKKLTGFSSKLPLQTKPTDSKEA